MQIWRAIGLMLMIYGFCLAVVELNAKVSGAAVSQAEPQAKVQGPNPVTVPNAPVEGSVFLENDLLKITVTPIGARIISLWDKTQQREDVKLLPGFGGLNTIRFGPALNIDDYKDTYALTLHKLPDGTQKLVAVIKCKATDEIPGVAIVTKEYVLSPGSTCLQLALEVQNEGKEEIGLIPWVHNMILRSSDKSEEAHMTHSGAFLFGKPHPEHRDQPPAGGDRHYFPAASWSSRVTLPVGKSSNTLAFITRPEDMFKLYNWHLGVDFTTLEVIAQPVYAPPGKSFRWNYCMIWAAPVRNIVYASPELVIGVSPHPTWLSPDDKELKLDFSATHDLAELKVHVRINRVDQPDKVITESDFTLKNLSSRDSVQQKLAVNLQDHTAYQMRLSFMRDGNYFNPAQAVGGRNEIIVPLLVGKYEQAPVAYPTEVKTDGRLRQIQPQVRASKLAYSCDIFDAFSFPSAQRCFRQDTFTSTGKAPLELQASAGEYESIQLVLLPKGKVSKTLNIVGSDLVGPAGTKVSCESVNDFIYVSTKTPSIYNALFPIGEYPEALLPVKQTTLKPDGNHPLFITWHIPSDAKPGFYRGTVKLSENSIIHEIPVEMKVWNVQIPLRGRWMEFASSLKGTNFDAHHPDGTPFSKQEQLDAIVDMHLKYRMTPCDSGIVNDLLSGNYPVFEKQMKKFVDAGATKIFLGQIPVLLNSYRAKLPEIEKYLKSKGWSDYFYVRPGFDEVAADQVLKVKAVLQEWKKVSSIPTMETYYHDAGAPELFGLLDIWSRSTLSPLFDDRIKAGDKFWKVNAIPGHLEPEPWTTGRRRYFWMWDQHYTGSYTWCVKYWQGIAKWGEDYWSDNGVGNLSAVLMWPHDTGILSTIRLEAMRDGLEDNALLWMLREKVETTKDMVCSDKATMQVLDKARALCQGGPLSSQIKSVDDLMRLRSEVGETLSALNTLFPVNEKTTAHQ